MEDAPWIRPLRRALKSKGLFDDDEEEEEEKEQEGPGGGGRFVRPGGGRRGPGGSGSPGRCLGKGRVLDIKFISRKSDLLIFLQEEEDPLTRRRGKRGWK